jgi:outer membrane protein OmpA-like peptidoglycan-associated protein
MGNDTNMSGRVSICGIHFDSGSSAIKPGSGCAIAEIAEFLKGNAGLKVYVVGHTDNVGALESNLTLSKERADTVITTLIGARGGIEAARLKTHGVASLAPVAANDTEEARPRTIGWSWSNSSSIAAR